LTDKNAQKRGGTWSAPALLLGERTKPLEAIAPAAAATTIVAEAAAALAAAAAAPTTAATAATAAEAPAAAATTTSTAAAAAAAATAPGLTLARLVHHDLATVERGAVHAVDRRGPLIGRRELDEPEAA
jgi:hypothetical protein